MPKIEQLLDKEWTS